MADIYAAWGWISWALLSLVSAGLITSERISHRRIWHKLGMHLTEVIRRKEVRSMNHLRKGTEIDTLRK